MEQLGLLRGSLEQEQLQEAIESAWIGLERSDSSIVELIT
jgi:hypothetical protein